MGQSHCGLSLYLYVQMTHCVDWLCAEDRGAETMAGWGNGACARAEKRTGRTGRRTHQTRGNPRQERSAAAGTQRPGDQEAPLQSGTSNRTRSHALRADEGKVFIFILLPGSEQRPPDAHRPHWVAWARVEWEEWSPAKRQRPGLHADSPGDFQSASGERLAAEAKGGAGRQAAAGQPALTRGELLLCRITLLGVGAFWAVERRCGGSGWSVFF